MSDKWLLENGYKPEDVIIGVDSAGAGLTLMTLLSLRDLNIALPKASFFLSLMGGDLSDFNGESYESRKGSDPLNTKEIIVKYCELYSGSNSISPPIKQNLSGLPNMFIQVEDDEVVLSDSLLFAQRA